MLCSVYTTIAGEYCDPPFCTPIGIHYGWNTPLILAKIGHVFLSYPAKASWFFERPARPLTITTSKIMFFCTKTIQLYSYIARNCRPMLIFVYGNSIKLIAPLSSYANFYMGIALNWLLYCRLMLIFYFHLSILLYLFHK